MMNLSPKTVLLSELICERPCLTLTLHSISNAPTAIWKGRKRPQWGYPFFGLTQEYKVQLHELIFDLTHFGKIEYFAVYEMPVQYRTFYVRKLINTREKEKRDLEKASSNAREATPQSKTVKGPGINRG
jgi:hypothetical protein